MQEALKIDYENNVKEKINTICLLCRNYKNFSCKKNLIPKDKYGGGFYCKRFHKKN